MEIQKNKKARITKQFQKRTELENIPWFQELLESYSNQDGVILHKDKHIEQESANFFCKGPDCKDFGLSNLFELCLYSMKTVRDDT